MDSVDPGQIVCQLGEQNRLSHPLSPLSLLVVLKSKNRQNKLSPS